VFRTLINDAKAAAGAVIGKYAVRASVAVPFVVAAGFGTAALTLMLAERFGSMAAYGMMATGFAALGVIAATVVSVKEQEEAAADTAAEKNDTAEVATDAAAQAAVQVPLALLGTLLTTPLGPGAAVGGAKILGRNLPLVLLLALLALLFWPTRANEAAVANTSADTSEEGEGSAEAGNGQWQHAPNGAHRRAA
jgi:hypothetical protein